MTEQTVGRNRLGEEQSPYLLQHADNPVHWQPWDEQSITVAEDHDVPIFLSVGYSACHWCHVMEHESFESDDVAEVLNSQYVPIKVDREERPDLDSIYQTICQMVTRSGGWPLSVWVTPDGRPFYVGTYFPKEERRGMPGFRDLLEGLAETWENDREGIENRADQWMRAIKGEVETVGKPEEIQDDDDLLAATATNVLQSADREHGGFNTTGPKFPQTTRIEVLLRASHFLNRADCLDVAIETLDAMCSRGMYDQLGGGFHRYSTDRKWLIPHFEKMLYDNATLSKTYLAGYRESGKEYYRDIVQETLEFVERELTHPDGGFFSSLDAESIGNSGDSEEGAFYTWTPQQVHDVVDDNTAVNVYCDRYGITESGDLEGRSVLGIRGSINELAHEYGLEPRTIESTLESVRRDLFEAREDRPRPGRDEKVLAGWNGLMISAFADASFGLDDHYATVAMNALEFLKHHLWDGNRLYRRYKDGDVGIAGYLQDYAFLARGAFDVYQMTGDLEYLQFALDLAESIRHEFWDREKGTLYFTPMSGEELIARPQELMDQSMPSSVGVAVDTLLHLSHFTIDDTFSTIASDVLNTHGRRIKSDPLQYTSLVLAADHWQRGAIEFTITADSVPDGWRHEFGERYFPISLVSRRPPNLDDWLAKLDLAEPPPIWADREQINEEPTIYVCQDFACSPPHTTIQDAFDWTERFRDE